MKNTFRSLLITIALVGASVFPTALAVAAPGDVFDNACTASKSSAYPDGNPAVCGNKGDGLFGIIKTVIQVLLIVAGVVAVIMIIIGGIRYVTSSGDQAHVKGAKDTILYAVVGLAVTILSYAIVTWVIKQT